MRPCWSVAVGRRSGSQKSASSSTLMRMRIRWEQCSSTTVSCHATTWCRTSKTTTTPWSSAVESTSSTTISWPWSGRSRFAAFHRTSESDRRRTDQKPNETTAPVTSFPPNALASTKPVRPTENSQLLRKPNHPPQQIRKCTYEPPHSLTSNVLFLYNKHPARLWDRRD